MIGTPGTNHKRTAAGIPLCGVDQLGYMWDKPEQVTCRACQLIMRHPELEAEVAALAAEGAKGDESEPAAEVVNLVAGSAGGDRK